MYSEFMMHGQKNIKLLETTFIILPVHFYLYHVQ